MDTMLIYNIKTENGPVCGGRAINVGKISNPKLNFIPYILIQIPKFNQYIKKDLYYYDYK